MRYDFSKEKFGNVEVRGIPCLFHDMRIDRATVPEGKFLYEVAGDDDSGGEPARIRPGILVNFFGTIISEQELPLEEGVMWIMQGDWKWM